MANTRLFQKILLGTVLALTTGILSAAELRYTSGQVQVKRAGAAKWAVIKKNTTVRDGDMVHTGRNSKLELRLKQGHRVQLKERTTLKVISADRGMDVEFKVLAGRVRAIVEKLKPGHHFQIKTPVAVAAVRGTVFDVAVGEHGSSKLSVLDGVVGYKDLEGAFNEVSVLKGQSVTIEPGQAPQAPEPVPQELLQEGMESRHGRPLGETPERAQDDLKLLAENESRMDDARNEIQETGVHQLKENLLQEGKTLVDAFGRRVRLEEYAVRPHPNEFSMVSITHRGDETNVSRLDVYAQNPLPDQFDLSKLFVKDGNDPMENWATGVERFSTNGGDYVRDWRNGGDPVLFYFGGGVYKQQVVFNNWFMEAKSADMDSPVLLSHWVPDQGFKTPGLGGFTGVYNATLSRDNAELLAKDVLDTPFGYQSFNNVGAGGLIIGDFRPVDTQGFTVDQRLDYFHNATVALKYNISEGFDRTAVLSLDGQTGPFDGLQVLAAREAVVHLQYNTLGGTPAPIDLYVTTFRINDQGDRLNFAQLTQLNFDQDVNVQTVFAGPAFFSGRRIDVVTNPRHQKMPQEAPVLQ